MEEVIEHKNNIILNTLREQTRRAVMFFIFILVVIVVSYIMIIRQENGAFNWQNNEISSTYAQLANLRTGSAKLDRSLHKQVTALLEADNSNAYFTRICYIVVVVMLLLAWLIIARINRQAQESLVEANEELAQRNNELALLNETLEQKVKERTASLQQALEDLGLTQKQLLESEKFAAIGQLASGFAHEINNPIGYINSNLQTLQKYLIHYRNLVEVIDGLQQAMNSKDQMDAARRIGEWIKTKDETNFEFINSDIANLIEESQAGVEKIRKIVIDIHDFAKPDKGVVEQVNMQSLVESVLNIISNQVKYKAVVVKDFQQVPKVSCNAQKIAQVFVNLVMNAVQSIPGKGQITIRIYSKDGFVCIAVRDTGVGISPENFSKIFDPFFTTKGSAAGLGLSASYDIVRKHNGRLTVDSETGKGSIFTVHLPIN